MMNKSFAGLVVGLLLTLLTAALLSLVGLVGIDASVMPVVLIISGMTAMGALAAFESLMEKGGQTPLIRISFNEMSLISTISEATPNSGGSSPRRGQGPTARSAPWDLAAGQLVGIDNALALARMRMDIETELRRLAHNAHLDLSFRPVGVVSLARELVDRRVVPARFLEALQDITKVCNRGIHGEEIPNDLVASVIRVGGELLEHLRVLPSTPSDEGQYRLDQPYREI
jgi:hypothetical protein